MGTEGTWLHAMPTYKSKLVVILTSRYQRAFVDYFEDELVLNGYDWQKVLREYLYEGKQPLINNVVAGRESPRWSVKSDYAYKEIVAHPLIHLGYAYELSSRELAMEALGLVATNYNFMHKYLDDASYTRPTKGPTTSPFEILRRISDDERLNGLFEHPGADNIEILFKDQEEIVLEYWNSWSLLDPKKQFEDSQYIAAYLLTATQRANEGSYDFFIVHVLTSSHAMRILLPFVPPRYHMSLLRQWWLFAIAVFMAQLRPKIMVDSVRDYDPLGRDWAWVEKQAIESQWCYDAHFVKALRALKEAALTWGDPEASYLKAALKLTDQFRGWSGFGP